MFWLTNYFECEFLFGNFFLFLIYPFCEDLIGYDKVDVEEFKIEPGNFDINVNKQTKMKYWSLDYLV